ncbi:MAG: single-stranded DNA-binding protein [Candidatus Goldiibacteriota bacterium]
MANLNRVFLMGNLTRDLELKYGKNGQPVTNMRLAVNRAYTTQTGEKKEEVCFVNIVVWGKQAESCHTYLAKGSAVFVEGRLQSRSWDAEDGTKKSILEVVADRVQFIGRKKKGDEEVSGEGDASAAGDPGKDDAPF